MAADTLVSVGVLISGIIIQYTNWYMIDPIIGLVVAIVILISTWNLLHDSLRLSLDGVPVGINPDKIKTLILEDNRVKENTPSSYMGNQYDSNGFNGSYCYRLVR